MKKSFQNYFSFNLSSIRDSNIEEAIQKSNVFRCVFGHWEINMILTVGKKTVENFYKFTQSNRKKAGLEFFNNCNFKYVS